MANNGTLRYYRQYIILKDDDTVKATYDDLFQIHNSDPVHLDIERYAVYLKKERDSKYGRWAVIDNLGNYVTGVKYRKVGDRIIKNTDGDSDVYTISVRCEDERYNLITTRGYEVFAKNYASIDNSSPNSIVCILRDGRQYGLGDVRTGDIILEPWYDEIKRLENDKLFQIYEHNQYESLWGLIDDDGKVLRKPQYANYIWGGKWEDYNLAVSKKAIDSNLTHYDIIDWYGAKVYETDAKRCEEYLRPASRVEKAVNAFIFIDREARHGRGSGRLLIIEYDRVNNRDEFYEIGFKFGRKDKSREKIQRICYKLAIQHKLAEKIYYCR